MNLITLLTDFGTRDWFVPSMKGVILSIAPDARIVDITHDIPPQNVSAGAFVLAAAARLFPASTVHVAVVDPGVGGARKAVAVRTADYIFLGPDNGLLSMALKSERIIEIRSIEREHLFRQPVSRTFHGRDIFASVAGHLANMTEFAAIGPALNSVRQLAVAEARVEKETVSGEVVFIDTFGNLTTNINQRLVAGAHIKHIELGGQRIPTISRCYSETAPETVVAVVNSLDLVEIGVRDGDAARALRLGIGAPVVVTLA